MNIATKLVLVRHKQCGRGYLYEAPIEAPVLEGDTVICQTRDGEQVFGIAVAVTIVPKCSTEYRFISICADAVEPLSKIIGKYEKIDF